MKMYIVVYNDNIYLLLCETIYNDNKHLYDT